MFYIKMLLYFSILVWLFIPLRQFKTRYFWLFLALAMTDPFSIILARSFHLVLAQFYVPFSILYLFIVMDFSKISFKKIAFSLLVIALGIISFIRYWEYAPIFILVVLLLVLILLVKKSFEFVIEKGSINIFHIVLVFYQMLNVLKFFSIINYFSTGIWFFFLSNILQTFIGIFFLIYREDNPKLLIRIAGPKEQAS